MALPTALQPLASAPRWVGWRWVKLPNGKLDKPPFRVDYPEFHASTQDPKSWAPFGTAAKALATGRLDGIGYVVRDDVLHAFIDLDDCRDSETGAIADWAMRIVEECGSYTEITPSKRGLRIIGTGEGLTREIHSAYKLPGGGTGELFFRAARYVTVTGDRLPDTPDKFADISDVMLDMLVQAGRAKAAEDSGAPVAHTSNPAAEAPLEDITSALAVIPNPGTAVHYDDWIRTGLAVFGASGGSAEGYAAWEQWSAKSDKFDDGACLKAWASFRRSPPKRIGFGSLYYLAKSEDETWRPTTWAQPVKIGGNAAEAVTPPDVTVSQPPKRRLRMLHLDDVEAMPDPEWLLDGLIPEKGFAVPYGPPKSGKSFVGVSWGLHIAAGKDWFGRKVKQGGVVLIAGEGVGGLGIRLKAMRQLYGIQSNIPFWVVPAAVNFRDPKAVAELEALIRETVGDEQISLIIVDTLARAMPGVEENSAKEVGEVVAACDHLRDVFGATIMPVHHAGKDIARGLRGSSAIHGAIDASFRIERQESGDVVLTNEDQKDAETAEPIVLEMRKVEIGARSSLVPVVRDGAEAPARAVKLAPGARAAMVALVEACAKGGQRSPHPEVPADAVPIGMWRAEFYARSPAETSDAKRQAFHRAGKDLIAAGQAAILHDYAWLVRRRDA